MTNEEERLWDIACDCLRFRKNDPLRLAENTTVDRILAALRQRADEATRAENDACAALMEHLGDNELAAAIRARKDKP